MAQPCSPGDDGLRVSPDDAAASLFVLYSPHVAQILTEHLGWSFDRYETWLADAIERLILNSLATAKADRHRRGGESHRSASERSIVQRDVHRPGGPLAAMPGAGFRQAPMSNWASAPDLSPRKIVAAPGSCEVRRAARAQLWTV